MSTNMYALNEIRHGNEDGEVTVFEVGDKIEGLSDEEVKALVANGSAGDKPADPEKAAKKIEDLEAEIAELKEKLGAAQAEQTPSSVPGPPTMTQPSNT